jgi:hypothetical protein
MRSLGSPSNDTGRPVQEFADVDDFAGKSGAVALVEPEHV